LSLLLLTAFRNPQFNAYYLLDSFRSFATFAAIRRAASL
jgi:hypothetical protein